MNSKNLLRYNITKPHITEEDIVHCYRKTNIFAKTVFQFENLNIQFFDTDGMSENIFINKKDNCIRSQTNFNHF